MGKVPKRSYHVHVYVYHGQKQFEKLLRRVTQGSFLPCMTKAFCILQNKNSI